MCGCQPIPKRLQFVYAHTHTRAHFVNFHCLVPFAAKFYDVLKDGCIFIYIILSQKSLLLCMYPVWKKKRIKKKEKTLNNEHNNIASIEMQTRWMREGEKNIHPTSQPTSHSRNSLSQFFLGSKLRKHKDFRKRCKGEQKKTLPNLLLAT